MRQVFYTALELAEIARTRRIPSFPESERGVQRWAEREGWNDLSESLSRWRKVAKGRPSREYNWSILPALMQAAIVSGDAQLQIVSAQAMPEETAERQLTAMKAAGRSARAHAVEAARAEVLNAITGYSIIHNLSRSGAIRAFVAAQAEWRARQDAEARRLSGAILTPPERELLASLPRLTGSHGFNLPEAVLGAANDRPDGKRSVAERSIWRWFAAYDRGGAGALSPVPAKVSEDVPKAFLDFLKFYSKPSKPTIAAAHAAYMAAVSARDGVQPDPVSLSQARYILRNRLSNLEQYVGREGLLTLKARLAYVARRTDDLSPTTIYTADGKTFDAEVADPVSRRPLRPEITSVLDVATRKCVGFAISRKENVIAVTEGLRRACLSHGIPAIFYTDRGPGYKNKVFDGDDGRALGGMMGRLGISKMHALPYNSQAKGVVERFNAVWNDLAKTMPTYMGRDMDKEAKGRVHRATRSDIRQFGTSNLLPSWQSFLAACDETIAAYNDRPHSGLPSYEDPETGRLRHMSPNEAWAAHVAQGFEPVTVREQDQDDLFRPYEVRMVNRAIVEWNTNQYFHIDLEPWHQKKVAVGYDLHQADRVWVRAIDEASGQPAGLICVAIFGGNRERYVPLSFQQAAEEGRVRAQLRRLSQKAEAVQDQLRAPLLEQQPVMTAPEFGQPTRELVPGPVERPGPAASAAITTDADLARLCLADPAELTEGRARLLREAMSRRSGRELLRIAGVDLDELDDLLRSAA